MAKLVNPGDWDAYHGQNLWRIDAMYSDPIFVFALESKGGASGSIGEDFPRELARVRDVLRMYEEVGPPGAFAASMIRNDIEEAEAAQASGDVVRIVAAYARLREIHA